MVWIEAKSLVPLAPGFFVYTLLEPNEFSYNLACSLCLPQLTTDEIAVLIDNNPIGH